MSCAVTSGACKRCSYYLVALVRRALAFPLVLTLDRMPMVMIKIMDDDATHPRPRDSPFASPQVNSHNLRCVALQLLGRSCPPYGAWPQPGYQWPVRRSAYQQGERTQLKFHVPYTLGMSPHVRCSPCLVRRCSVARLMIGLGHHRALTFYSYV